MLPNSSQKCSQMTALLRELRAGISYSVSHFGTVLSNSEPGTLHQIHRSSTVTRGQVAKS